MIVSLAGIALTLILILCFCNIRWGAACFLAYSILVPLSDITVGGLHFGENLVKTILLLSLLYDFKLRHHYKLSWKFFIPFFFYYLTELAIIPFQDETPTGWMYNNWRVSFMGTMFGAFVIYNVLKTYPKSLKLFRYSAIFSIIVAGVYGLFLTTTGGINPYIFDIVVSTGSVSDAQDLMGYFSADDRMFGRISSVFMHPMSFGLFIGLAFIYVFAIRSKIKKWLFIALLLILSLDALFCGVRSCIGGLVVAVAYYLIFSRNIKIGLAVLFVGIIGYNIISTMPELSDYLGSIADIHNTQSNVRGSSIDMRLEQLNGCFKEIQRSPILGKGFGWVSYYKANFGDHPVILAFESLIFVVLCNNGILGLFIWAILIYLVLRSNHRLKLKDKYVVDSLLVFYITYSCITGEYGYMKYFLLFYICMAFENRNGEKNTNTNQIEIHHNRI